MRKEIMIAIKQTKINFVKVKDSLRKCINNNSTDEELDDMDDDYQE